LPQSLTAALPLGWSISYNGALCRTPLHNCQAGVMRDWAQKLESLHFIDFARIFKNQKIPQSR
jgi:hypothetical protein